MHYCQSCNVSEPMRPDDDDAVCPVCGRRDRARRMPLLFVTGASAAGKTALHAPLAAALADVAAVFDFDWLIDAFGRAAEGGEIDWVAVRQAWVAVAHGEAQQDRATVVLGQIGPNHLVDLPGLEWAASTHFLLLDCGDEVRRARIEARPAWRGRDVDEQLAWARWLREHIDDHIRTDQLTPDESVRAIATWVRGIVAS